MRRIQDIAQLAKILPNPSKDPDQFARIPQHQSRIQTNSPSTPSTPSTTSIPSARILRILKILQVFRVLRVLLVLRILRVLRVLRVHRILHPALVLIPYDHSLQEQAATKWSHRPLLINSETLIHHHYRSWVMTRSQWSQHIVVNSRKWSAPIIPDCRWSALIMYDYPRQDHYPEMPPVGRQGCSPLHFLWLLKMLLLCGPLLVFLVGRLGMHDWPWPHAWLVGLRSLLDCLTSSRIEHPHPTCACNKALKSNQSPQFQCKQNHNWVHALFWYWWAWRKTEGFYVKCQWCWSGFVTFWGVGAHM